MPHTLTLCYIADATNIHVRRWLGYFVNRGHRVYCLSDRPGQIDGVTVIELPGSQDVGCSRPLNACIRQVREIIQEIQPDLVHVFFLYHLGWLAALSGFHPLIITLLGPDLMLSRQNYKSGLQLKFAHLLNSLSLKQADLVTTVSDNLCKAASRMGMGLVPIELIPIGVDPHLFRPDLETTELREKLQIPDDSFVVLSPRRMAPRYNQNTIIESIPKVLEEIPRAVFILKDAFSDNPERLAYVEALREQAEALGVQHAIRWVGEVPMAELPYYYALSDVVVSVPTVDGMPVTIFEAMAAQKPLIVGDLASYNEVIIHGQTGLRVPVHNSQVLAGAIVKMHHNPALAKRMVEESQVILHQYGIFDEQMMRMERYYNGLLSQDIPRRHPVRKALNRFLLKALVS
ncbi:MAG TPA: glycosyltransferase family 4 protein [Oculatellaceae cyanobacterium]